MEITQVKISKLKPSEYNPRKWDQKAIEQLTESIKRFGLVDPIIVNSAKERHNIVIGGHFRLEVAKRLGYQEVPVYYINIPDVKKEQELNLRLNKNTGDWDFDLLANLDEDLLKDIGFDSEELDKIFQLDLGEDDFDADAEHEKIAEARTKRGDIYTLGSHRVMCGDATSKDDMERLMDGARADMVFTDPPYNIGFSYNKHNDKLKYEDYKSFCRRFFELLQCERVIITPGPKNLSVWHDILKIRDIGWTHETSNDAVEYDEAVWHKSNARSGASCFYFRTCEPIIFYGRFKKYRRTDFFSYARSIKQEKRDAEKAVSHYAPGKPIALVTDIIKSFSEQGEIVLDAFLGSGSTLIACQNTNRICYGMEIDEKYCDVIVTRYCNHTGINKIIRNGEEIEW